MFDAAVAASQPALCLPARIRTRPGCTSDLRAALDLDDEVVYPGVTGAWPVGHIG